MTKPTTKLQASNIKVCAGEGCGIAFEPHTANQKYAYPTCRKSLTKSGTCQHRRDSGIWHVPANPVDGEHPKDNASLRESYMKLLKEYDRIKSKKDDLVDAVYSAVVDQASDTITKVQVKPPVKDRRKQKKTEEVAVAILADWQLAKVTPTYNTEVCEDRIEKYAQKVIDLTEIQRADHPVKELHVWVLGDIVEGELIFPGQSFLVDGGLYRQVTVDGPRIMRNFLTTMLGHFEKVHVTAIIGNHGAIGGRSRRDHDPETNADRMLYRVVQWIFEDEERITFNIPDGRGDRNWYAVAKIGNYSSLLCHGDQFTGLSSFITFQKKVYGWKVGAVKEHFDDVYVGHLHTPTKMTFNTIQVRISGSPECTNTYAMENLAAIGRPSQPLMFVNPDKGIVTAEYNCWLD